jgi:hypothetical protein
MKHARILAMAFTIAAVVSGAGATTRLRPLGADDSKYRVFCADNKIEIEQRTVEQEKNARGSNVCMLGEFDYLSDAEKFAEQFGGKGASCKCN